MTEDIISKALLRSLTEAPLLLEDLPEATAFPSHSLAPPKDAVTLNFQQKLGHLYEDALAILLESTPRYDGLEQGMQLRRTAGQTLGELDFLIRDLVLDQVFHLELAVKFYLAVESENGVLLPGPDARDNYYRKLEKMRSHQLVLVRKHKELLPEDFQAEEIIVQQLVQGCIFNHVNATKPVKSEFLNPNGRRGKWLHAEDCSEYFGENARLEIIPKPLWPVPLDIMKGIQLEPWELDENTDRCVMVRANDTNTPYFIAPSGYPWSQ